MGKGDRRSRRGKIFRGTFGSTRKHKLTKATSETAGAPTSSTETPKKKAPKKKKEE